MGQATSHRPPRVPDWFTGFGPLRRQYFLCFALLGALFPYLALFLKDGKGLEEDQIGFLMAINSAAIMIAPVALTYLADTRVDPRRVLTGVFLVSAAAILALHQAEGLLSVAIAFTIFGVAFMGSIPLQDGLNFTIQKQREEQGLPATAYSQIRVWGTIGFIFPGVAIYFLIRWGWPVTVVALVALVCGVAGLINTFLLPRPNQPAQPKEKSKRSAPTRDVLRVLLRPNALFFCVAMILLHIAAAAYFTFYPLFLTRIVGVSAEWVGLIFGIGVFMEIFFVLGMGRLIGWLGLRRLTIIGSVVMGLRIALLVAFPTVFIAVFSQIWHGFTVMVIQMIPVVYLNSLAHDRFRSSMQGVYLTLVVGAPRVVGSLLGGLVAVHSLIWLYTGAFLLCLLAALVLCLGYRPGPMTGPGTRV